MNCFRSLLRSYFSLAGLSLAGIVMAMLLLPGLFIVVVGLKQGDFPGTDIPRTFFLSYIGLTTILLNAIAWAPLSELLRQSRLLPVSTAALAAFFLFLPALVTATTNACILGGYSLLYTCEWPIFATSTLVGSSTTVFAAALIWLRTARIQYAIAAPILVLAWTTWIVWHFYPNGFLRQPEFWSDLSMIDVTVLAAGISISAVVGVAAYRKYRCGVGTADWLTLLMEPPPLSLRNKRYDPPLPSNENSAKSLFLQMIREQTKFQSTGGEVLIGFITYGSVLLSLNSRSAPLEGTMILSIMMAGMGGLVIGLFTTVESWLKNKAQGRAATLTDYFATLPFSDAELGRLLIQSWFPALRRMSIAFLLAIGAAILTHRLVAGPRDYFVEYSQVWLVRQFGPWGGLVWVLGVPVLMWAVAGAFGTVVLAGRPRTALWSVVYVCGLAVLIMWAWHFGNSPARQFAQLLLFSVTAVAGCAATAGLLVVAMWKQLLTRGEAISCFIIASALFLVCYLAIPSTAYWKSIAGGLAVLVTLPIPGIPAAIAANRHR